MLAMQAGAQDAAHIPVVSQALGENVVWALQGCPPAAVAPTGAGRGGRATMGRGCTCRRGTGVLTTTPSHTILVVSLGLVAWIFDLKALSACWPVIDVRRSMCVGEYIETLCQPIRPAGRIELLRGVQHYWGAQRAAVGQEEKKR